MENNEIDYNKYPKPVLIEVLKEFEKADYEKCPFEEGENCVMGEDTKHLPSKCNGSPFDRGYCSKENEPGHCWMIRHLEQEKELQKWKRKIEKGYPF